jgi:hypothetical protein
VGRSCAVCAKRVATALDGAACIACDRAYHAKCLEDPDRCPTCGASMSALEQTAADSEARANEEARRRGRLLVWAVIVPCALFEVFSIARTIAQGAAPLVMSSFVRVAIETFLVWRAVQGTTWAQRALAFFFGLGAVVTGVIMASASAVGAVVLGGVIVCCVFGIWVFVVSKDARAYFDSGGAHE